MLAPYLKARYPVIYMVTAEEARAELECAKSAQELKMPIRTWSCTEGFKDPSNPKDKGQQCEDPVEALQNIKDDVAENGMVYIFKDLHQFWNFSPKVLRLVRDIARDFKQQRKALIIISPIMKVPEEIQRDAQLIELDLPDRPLIRVCLDALCESNKKIVTLNEQEKSDIVEACMGLTTCEAENAVSKAIVERRTKKDANPPPIATLVMAEKALAIKKTGVLEYHAATEQIGDVGGLTNYKRWIEGRKLAYLDEARAFGLKSPKGVLFVGLPGCGKSLSAKATASFLGVPLLKFEVGRVFGSYIGQSEANIRLVTQTAEAVGKCVLWIDEIEKALSGAGGSGANDGGTTKRVFGTLITWLQDKKAPVFVIATANNIDDLSSELLRKGRFDEIFYIELPDAREREEILKIHLRKRGRDVSKFDLSECVTRSEGFSGAELEAAVEDGMFTAFALKQKDPKVTDVTDLHILRSIVMTVPLSRSRKPQLQKMKEWAENNAQHASKTNDEILKEGRKLQID